MKQLILLTALSLSLGASAVAAPVMPRLTGVQAQSSFLAPQVQISKKQAMQIAVQAAGGGKAKAAHLDDFHDRPVWEVTVLNRPFQYEVTVDANSGNVLRIRKHREDN